MSVEEFAVGPAQSGLLTDREVVSLFLYFTVNPKPPISFKSVTASITIFFLFVWVQIKGSQPKRRLESQLFLSTKGESLTW